MLRRNIAHFRQAVWAMLSARIGRRDGRGFQKQKRVQWGAWRRKMGKKCRKVRRGVDFMVY